MKKKEVRLHLAWKILKKNSDWFTHLPLKLVIIKLLGGALITFGMKKVKKKKKKKKKSKK